MDSLEELFLALLLHLVGRKVFPVSWFFTHIDVREVVLSWWRTPELKESPSYTWWIDDSPLFLYARSARTCSRRCQRSSMINILCTAFWVPSRVIHIIRCSQHPESFVLTLDWKDLLIDSVVAFRFGVVSQFSESIVERWYFARVSQRNVVVPGILKSMSASSPSWVHDSHHEQQWIFSILLRSTSSSTLSVLASWYTWESSCPAAVSVTSRPVLSWVCSTLRTLAVFRWTCVISLCFNKSPFSIWRTEFFVKIINIDLLRRGRVSSIFHVHQVALIYHELDLEFGWVDWKHLLGLSNNFSFWLSNSFTFWLLKQLSKPNSLVHSCRSEILGGGLSDMLIFFV